MRRPNNILRGACISTLVLLSATAALAGKNDRARAEIARAAGKLEAADRAGATGDLPRIVANAHSELDAAREDHVRGDNEHAIIEAKHASTLADLAIAQSQRYRSDAESDRRFAAENAAAAAQQDAATANERANAANARAVNAQQAASAAAAQVDAMREAQAEMPPPATTVMVEKTASATPVPHTHVTRHRVLRHSVRRPARTVAERTTVTTESGE